MGAPVYFYLTLKRRKSMKKSYGQTFMLTISNNCANFCNVFNIHNNSQACIFQSALTPVRSDECGLFA